jgi:hypothetical protein
MSLREIICSASPYLPVILARKWIDGYRLGQVMLINAKNDVEAATRVIKCNFFDLISDSILRFPRKIGLCASSLMIRGNCRECMAGNSNLSPLGSSRAH